MSAAQIKEPSALIRIARLYSPSLTSLQLYEITRGVWRLGARKDAVRFAFAVAQKTIVEVYEVGAWHPAGSTPYTTRSISQVQVPGRWEFSGKPAIEELRERYCGKSVDHYFRPGSANPVVYVNA